MAAQLKEIVDRLNAEPFNLDLSLLVFDEKDPLELMEILKKVLTFLDPKHDVELRGEKPDAMYQRISEFLHILGYQCSFDIEFQNGLMSGDKNTIHPILYWLLSNLEALRKRAYLAKFCMNLEVPEEFLREEQVASVYQNYKELQAQFKAHHSHVEQERHGRMNPADLQREVQQLDAEREQLAQKIQLLKAKTERDEGFAQLLQVTSMLRKEQEEEARLAEKLQEQKYQLEQTEQLYIERAARLREMREAQMQEGEGSAEAMFKVLSTEVIKSREALQRVRKEGEEKMEQLRDMDSALSEPPVRQVDIDNLENEIQAMQNEIHAHTEKINEQNQDSRLAVYKQQANLVAKKKEAVLKDKKTLEDERDSLSKDLSIKEREYEEMKGHKYMKRDDFKNYAAALRDKSAKFKRLKAELSEMRQELAELEKTEQSLKEKDPTPAGLVETEQMLERASVEKSQVDRAKGKTLDEISAIVQKINQQLKEKKNKLAPQIKALRSIRQNFQQVEVKYLEKKGHYDQESAIIFDWDDTLFPTWYVTEVVNPCLEDVHCDQLPADSPFAQCLSSQAQAVSDILRCACVCGRVAIVTLAQHPWVLNSAAKYLPGLDLPGLLEELDIPVIYARQYLKRYVIQEGTQEGECLWTLAKQAAMTKVLRKLYGREAPWMNVLSIGDSTVERTAIMELMWRSAHEDGSGRLPCCKTIKLVDDPSVEQLHTQLVILTTWMKQLVQHGHDFDFSLDDSDGTIHEQFANSAT